MDAAEKRQLIAIMLLTALLTGLSFGWREKRLSEGRAVLGQPDTAREAWRRQEIMVDVGGAVLKPGIYRLMPGSRVEDAVAQAGGLLPEADRDKVNMARLCADGARINISYKKHKTRPPALTAAIAPLAINSAGAADFDVLPGVGPELARRIVAYREKYGAFKTVSQLKDVAGIGEARFARIKDLVKL